MEAYGCGEEDEISYDFALRITGTLPCGVILARSDEFPHRQFIIVPEQQDDAQRREDAPVVRVAAGGEGYRPG